MKTDKAVIPNVTDTPLWRFLEHRSEWTLGDMARHIEELEACISEAGPLAWVHSDNFEDAYAWEKKAYALIHKK